MIFLNSINNSFLLFISFLIAIATAISVHEMAHAWVAWRLGDPTAKNAGRISLNPLVHLDPLGTIFLILAGFGWGKPVPVNSNNFQNPKHDELKVALAGPISNLLVAIISALLIRFIPLGEIPSTILLAIAQFNIILMIFNLLPIPPLDGSAILQIFLPTESYRIIQQLSFPLLIALMFFAYATPYVSELFSLTSNFFFRILIG